MTKNYEIIKDDYLISTDKALLNIDVMHSYLSKESYWAQHIPREIVEKAVANSLCFGLYCNNQQIGFARMITDTATFAYLADVFVLEAYRGKGLASWMMEVILAHPQLQGLRGILLRTRDAQELYKKFGWEEVSEENRKRFMVRATTSAYPEPKVE